MKLLKCVVVGLGIGFICTMLSLLLFMGINEVTLQLLAWFIASAIYGGSTVIFDCKRMSKLLKGVLHFAILACVTAVVTMLFYREYVWTVIGCFTAYYLIVCGIMCAIEKHNIKKINEKLKSKT